MASPLGYRHRMTGTRTPATGLEGTRKRLLETAARLFHEEGVHVGVDVLCREAGVSKRSMYQLFGTKDELVAASLAAVEPTWAAALLPPEELQDPRARILHVFERLEVLEPEHGFLGCPFLSAALEVKSSDHPASAVVRRQKEGLTGFFEHEAARGGAHDPSQLAAALVIVFDGASSRSVVRAETLDGLAVRTAATLLDASGVAAA